MQRALLCGALGLAVVTGFAQGAARAEDGEEKSSIWDFNPVEDLMRGLGFKNGTENEANYRERSPLVIPPNTELPKPEFSRASAVPASWPVDPDAKKRKAAAKAKLYTQANKSNQGSLDPESEGGGLLPGQLNPGGAPTITGSTRPADTTIEDGAPIAPSKLGYIGGLFTNAVNPNREETGTFTGEPPRANLTQPPTGYQTPSPTAPYGVSKKRAPAKARDIDYASGEVRGEDH